LPPDQAIQAAVCYQLSPAGSREDGVLFCPLCGTPVSAGVCWWFRCGVPKRRPRCLSCSFLN